MSATVTINGKTYTGKTSVKVINNVVYIDGKPVDGETHTEPVKIEITGDLLSVKSDGPVSVTGDIHGDVDCGGSLKCGGSIGGSVDSGGSVTCKGNISGDVDAGGSINV